MFSSSYALKEWDAQVQALARGDVALVLRKGGIMETHEGFEVEHRSFFLYPTFLHQNPAEVRDEFAGLLRPDPSPGTVVFPAFARVVDVWRIEDLDRALSLQEAQVLNADAIRRRFHYRNRPWLHVLLLDVVRLGAPSALPETPEMLGCVSWVPLADALEAAGEHATPNERLEALREELHARLS